MYFCMGADRLYVTWLQVYSVKLRWIQNSDNAGCLNLPILNLYLDYESLTTKLKA